MGVVAWAARTLKKDSSPTPREGKFVAVRMAICVRLVGRLPVVLSGNCVSLKLPASPVAPGREFVSTVVGRKNRRRPV